MPPSESRLRLPLFAATHTSDKYETVTIDGAPLRAFLPTPRILPTPTLEMEAGAFGVA